MSDGTHVSQWPSYDLPEKDIIRDIAIWDDEHRCVINSNGEVIIQYVDIKQFVKEVTEKRLIIFCERVLEVSILEDILSDKRCNCCASRTGGLFGVYIKSRRSAWLVERRIWDNESGRPDREFLLTLNMVFKRNGMSRATPGSLGEAKIRETLPRGTRYNRPNHMLRSTILQNNVGGRADTIEQKKLYDTFYECDINSAYIYCSQETIDPAEHPKRFHGISGTDRFFSYFAHITFSIPPGRRIKFGPLAIREDKLLHFVTEEGVEYEGWYWKEEIDRALVAGYQIEMDYGYGWEKGSDWLQTWAQSMHAMKMATTGKEKEIIKRMGVAAIGRFGMAPEKLSLVHYKDRKPKDSLMDGESYVSILIKDAGPEESSITDYFIHIEPDINSNRLTHISSYIIMKCRCELYDRMMKEEENENTILASNYDSYYVIHPSSLYKGTELGEWKERTWRQATINGPRSVTGIREGVPVDHRPGTPKKGRKVLRN